MHFVQLIYYSSAKCPRGTNSECNILHSVYSLILGGRCCASGGLVQTIMAISMDVSVAREYVRQQLESMEVRHVTQEEIEAYTLGI